MNELKCPNCGQATTKNGQPFKNRSALNTHINVHCAARDSYRGGGGSDRGGGGGHECKFSLLNPANATAARAIQAGYTKYCKECGELQ